MDRITINGATYLGHDACAFGDYGGAGSVGRANIDALLEQFSDDFAEGAMGREWDNYGVTGTPALVVLYGMYSSEAAYLREDIAAETLDALDDYPCIDDERVSEIEMQWETEAWESWVRRDLYGALPEDLQEKADGIGDSDLFECYRRAMEATNTYPVPEYSDVYIDVDRIADSYAKHVAAFDPAADATRNLFTGE